LGGPALVALAALAVCARVQTTYWRDGEAFWAHALDCTRDNDVAEDNLGAVLLQRGQTDAALVHVQRALAIQPNNAGAHINLGDILVGKGQIDEALTEYQTAVGLEPGLYEAHDDLGIALFKKGQVDAAIGQYQAAIALDPDQAGAHNNLSRARLQKRDLDGAMTQAREALKLRPDLADAHRNLGVALVQAGRLDEGIEQLRQALAIQPGLVEAQTALTQIAWIEATSPDPTVRNGIRAMQLAEQTDRLGGGTNAMQAATLAAAYAEAGRFPEAVTAARRAVELAGSLTNAAGAAMTADFTAQLQSYQTGRPYRVGQSKN
jgi:tetratricopeptide (TPR) repeat protein